MSDRRIKVLVSEIEEMYLDRKGMDNGGDYEPVSMEAFCRKYLGVERIRELDMEVEDHWRGSK